MNPMWMELIELMIDLHAQGLVSDHVLVLQLVVEVVTKPLLHQDPDHQNLGSPFFLQFLPLCYIEVWWMHQLLSEFVYWMRDSKNLGHHNHHQYHCDVLKLDAPYSTICQILYPLQPHHDLKRSLAHQDSSSFPKIKKFCFDSIQHLYIHSLALLEQVLQMVYQLCCRNWTMSCPTLFLSVCAMPLFVMTIPVLTYYFQQHISPSIF